MDFQVDPPEEVTRGSSNERARKPWSYCQPGKGLALYGPPVCHSQYHVSSLLFTERPKKSFWSAFSSDVIVDVSRIQARVHLVHRLTKTMIISQACEKEAKDTAFRPHFWAPLVRPDERVVQLLNLDVMDVLFALKGSKKTHACFQIYSRSGRATPVIEARLTNEQVAERAKKVPSSVNELYAGLEPTRLAAADVFSPEQWETLSWKESPYQLVVVPSGADDAPDLLTASWTYFQVPSAWDVDIVEAYGDERVILLGDAVTCLAAVKGAQITERTAETDAEIALSKREQNLVSMAMQGLGEKQTGFSQHLTNTIIERPEGRFFAATSWASVIVLKRSKDGTYRVHSLYHHGDDRALYVMRRRARRVAHKLVETSARIQKIDEQMVDARKAAIEERSAVANLQVKIRALREKRDKSDAYARELVTTTRQLMGTGQPDDTAIAIAYAETIAAEREKQRLLDHELSIAEGELAEAEKVLAAKMEGIEQDLAPLVKERAALNEKIHAAKEQLERETIRRMPDASVDGSADFDYDVKPQPGWRQIVLGPDELTLTHAVTMGISSCAGGVTFTAGEGPPDVIIFWHIDAPPTVPVKEIIESLWPDLDACPPLRTIVSVHPSVWELNKYRKDILYPAAIRDRCDTIYLARGSHLYDSGCAVVAGSDYFGVDVSNPDSVSLVFTNDFEKRTPIERGVSQSSVAKLSIGLCDFNENIYGDYRFQDKPIKDPSSFKEYLARLNDGDAVIEVRADKAKHGRVCRLPGLGLGLFDALKSAAGCKAVLDLGCFALGEKGDQELGGISAEKHYAWHPGPARPSPKSKQQEPIDIPEKIEIQETDEEPPLPEQASCYLCAKPGVRARHSCTDGCRFHGTKLCTQCAEGITGKNCLACREPIVLWDMSHNTPW